MYSSTATFPSKCGTGNAPLVILSAGGKVDQTRCSSVETVAAASAILRPCWASCASAPAAPRDVLRNGTQKSVTAKMAAAPLKAAISEFLSLRSALTTSTPCCCCSFWALAELRSRVTARTFQPALPMNDLATAPPWSCAGLLAVHWGDMGGFFFLLFSPVCRLHRERQ